MRRSKLRVYLHLVWGTHDRLPLVRPEIERRLYRSIAAEVRKLRCRVLAMGGMPDHVHLVVQLAATVTVAELLKQVKGVSSTFARVELCKGEFFSWHEGYSAFSVSGTHLARVIEYANGQKQHHASADLHPAWEEIDEEPGECVEIPEVEIG